VTFEPTKDNPNNASSVFSFTVPAELCNMGGALPDSDNCLVLADLNGITGSLHGGAVALISNPI
jgi:hypothetical protein